MLVIGMIYVTYNNQYLSKATDQEHDYQQEQNKQNQLQKEEGLPPQKALMTPDEVQNLVLETLIILSLGPIFRKIRNVYPVRLFVEKISKKWATLEHPNRFFAVRWSAKLMRKVAEFTGLSERYPVESQKKVGILKRTKDFLSKKISKLVGKGVQS